MGCFDVINYIGALTNLLTIKAIIVLLVQFCQTMNSIYSYIAACVLWIPDATSSGLHMGSFQNERKHMKKYLQLVSHMIYDLETILKQSL